MSKLNTSVVPNFPARKEHRQHPELRAAVELRNKYTMQNSPHIQLSAWQRVKNYQERHRYSSVFKPGKWLSRAGTWCWSGMDTAPLLHAPNPIGAAAGSSRRIPAPPALSPASLRPARAERAPSGHRSVRVSLEGRPAGDRAERAPTATAAASPCCSRGSSSC